MIERKDWIPWPQDNTAAIKCDACGNDIKLNRAVYAIDPVGIVTPDIQCSRCGHTHEATRLIGYPAEIIWT